MALDGYGLRDLLLTRPTITASYPVPVRRVAALLHASFRHRLTTTPLRFANPSPPSGWVEDFHLQAAEHARHTEKSGAKDSATKLLARFPLKKSGFEIVLMIKLAGLTNGRAILRSSIFLWVPSLCLANYLRAQL